MMDVSGLEIGALIFFVLAVVHTFAAGVFRRWAHRYPEGSIQENFFHLLSEVEVVFGLWAAMFMIFYVFWETPGGAIDYLESRNFTEPVFVFVIMVVCSSRPIVELVAKIIERASRRVPLESGVAYYLTCLILGPLLGSLITEPAAMTVTAALLIQRFYRYQPSQRFIYVTLGLLFVNISIGGTLTPYAAPPVLMVASTWGWDLDFMLSHFAWKAIVAILISTFATAVFLRSEFTMLRTAEQASPADVESSVLPKWMIFCHLLFLALIVVSAHHMVVFCGVFLFFLGFAQVTREYQTTLKIREGLLVAFFLGGLVVLGGLQGWWLSPILRALSAAPLYLASMGLTAFTDNAALTYLGAQVEGLSEASRYALVAGAVVGGGLTVIANAPNLAGLGMLSPYLGEAGFQPFRLFKNALFPTAVAAVCFWFL